MTRPAALLAGLNKEGRALLPTWAACMAAMAAMAVVGDRRLELVRLAYIVGALALAALSIGHEYTHGTLPIFLSLPPDRRRLLLVKLSVLIPMQATLGALAWFVVPPMRDFDPGSTIPMLLMLCALLLAPWLTMLGRSPLAGVVFAMGITGQVHLFAALVAFVKYGWAEGNIPSREQLRLDVLWWGLAGVGAVAAVATWRRFMRLEAIEGPGPSFSWPWGLIGATNEAGVQVLRRRNPLWLLVVKELRLQQMALVIAVGYPMLWAGFALASSRPPEGRGILDALGLIYAALLAILIGSLASAEERHMRTLEWQLLMPIALWKQWTVKTAIALGLAAFLGVVLPVVLAAGDVGFNLWPVAIIVVLTSGSLYISSLCDSGLKAMAVSAPVMLLLVMGIGSWVGPSIPVGAYPYTFAIVLFAFVVLALRLAYANHVSA